jgi:hypothetical protein
MFGTAMATFFLISFAVGALLGKIATVWQCIVAVLLFATVVLAVAIHNGSQLGTALLVATGVFVCIQLGYVAGIGLWAVVTTKWDFLLPCR